MNSKTFKNDDMLFPEWMNNVDKVQFDIYLAQSKLIFPKMANDEWLIKMGIIAFMKKEKFNLNEPPNDEEIAEIRNKYSNDTVFYYSDVVSIDA
jgi:hypothetical protein